MQNSVPEGYFTSKHLFKLAQKHQIDAPITEAVYGLLYENKSLFDIIDKLMSRPLTSE